MSNHWLGIFFQGPHSVKVWSFRQNLQQFPKSKLITLIVLEQTNWYFTRLSIAGVLLAERRGRVLPSQIVLSTSISWRSCATREWINRGQVLICSRLWNRVGWLGNIYHREIQFTWNFTLSFCRLSPPDDHFNLTECSSIGSIANDSNYLRLQNCVVYKNLMNTPQNWRFCLVLCSYDRPQSKFGGSSDHSEND